MICVVVNALDVGLLSMRYGIAKPASAFAVTPFLGDITPFSKPGRRFGNYVASLGRSFLWSI